MTHDDALKILAPAPVLRSLSRRGFLRGATLTAAATSVLTACGSTLSGGPAAAAPPRSSPRRWRSSSTSTTGPTTTSPR